MYHATSPPSKYIFTQAKPLSSVKGDWGQCSQNMTGNEGSWGLPYTREGGCSQYCLQLPKQLPRRTCQCLFCDHQGVLAWMETSHPYFQQQEMVVEARGVAAIVISTHTCWLDSYDAEKEKPLAIQTAIHMLPCLWQPPPLLRNMDDWLP